MFEKLFSAPDDKIIKLMHTFSADPRADKIDLGVGVYKNKNGSTPIMHSVKKAENLLWEEQSTKSYVGLAGDFEFHDVMRDLILKNCVGEDCVASRGQSLVGRESQQRPLPEALELSDKLLSLLKIRIPALLFGLAHQLGQITPQ